MKTIRYWGKPVALLALVLSPVGGMKATATLLPRATTDSMMLESQIAPSRVRDSVQLAQRVRECRAAARSAFIYQDRSTTNRLRALQPNEQVILAEDRGKDGWIAISSPISGFVQAKDLKRCLEVSTSPSRRNLCRQVIHQGVEGVAVRERPSITAPQTDTVFFGDQVTLSNPPQFLTDDMGREWARLAAPLGWMSNGIPSRGDINLQACPQE